MTSGKVLCARRSRGAIANTMALFLLIVVIATSALAVTAMQYLSSSGKTDGGASSPTSPSPAGPGSAFLVQVVEGPTMSPVAGMTVVAGPIASPNDVARTPGGPTLTECVHQVPSGSSVGANGVVVSNGTTTTFAPCPLTTYVTNSTGWVSITDATGVWYFIKAGNVNEWADIVIGVLPNNTVNMAMSLTSGNVTVPSSVESCVTGTFSNMTSGCTRVPGTPVLWPATTMVWPCGEGVPSGSAGTAQGFYGGYYVAYAFVNMPNGTKAALSNDCDVGSL